MHRIISSLALIITIASSNTYAAYDYDILSIGPTDTEHTDADGNRTYYGVTLADNGTVSGQAFRYSSYPDTGAIFSNGASAWYFNGTNTYKIGLTDIDHTSIDEKQRNVITGMNSSGWVIGYADRYVIDTVVGNDAWLYDGANTVTLGIYDAEHTNSYGYYNSGTSFINSSGDVLGGSARYSGNTYIGNTLWIYNGSGYTEIGLLDAEHTRTNGSRTNSALAFNDAGQAVGGINRYDSNNTSLGRSAWIYNGTSTIEIGLIDSTHTSSTGVRTNNVYTPTKGKTVLNQSGQTIGSAIRYNGTSFNGTSTWIYNGTDTVQIGLTDAAHTRTSDGWQSNDSTDLNESGQVIGHASRYDGSSNRGRSAWLYDGVTITEIGLSGGVHSRSDGYYSNIEIDLNELGQVIGRTDRFSPTDTTTGTLGISSWFYDGTSTMEIGLMDATHTRDDGYRYSFASLLNDAGQASGISYRYDGMTGVGQSAWLFNNTDNTTYSLIFSERSDGYAFSQIDLLDDNGLALGRYQLFSDTQADLGMHAFMWSIDDGFFDLGSLIYGDLNAEGWSRLSDTIGMYGADYIIGNGLLSDGSNGLYYMSQHTAVPIPASIWLFASGLAGILGMSRTRARHIGRRF